MTYYGCKVIACYAGPRRQLNNNETDQTQMLEVIKTNVYNSLLEATGIDSNVHVVIIQSDEESDKRLTDAINEMGHLYSSNVFLDGPRKKDLTISYVPNNGGSFKAYLSVFEKYWKEYTHWCFVEDDVITSQEGLFAAACVALGDPTIGFIGLAPICPHPIHCGGGCGFTSTEKMAQAVGHPSFNLLDGVCYNIFEANEIMFTNIYDIIRLKVVNLTGCSPLCSNWETHDSQARWATPEFIALPKVYSVGLK